VNFLGPRRGTFAYELRDADARPSNQITLTV